MTALIRIAAQGGFWLYLVRVVNMAIGFLISVLLVRHLSQEAYGAYQFILTLGHFLVFFSSMGLDAVLLRFVPEFLQNKQYGNINRLLKTSFLIRFFTVFFLLLIINLFSGPFFSFFNIPLILQTWFLGICLYFLLARSHEIFGDSLLNAYLEQKKMVLIDMSTAVLRIVLLVVVIRFHLGFGGLVYWLVISELFAFTLFLGAAAKIIRGNREMSKTQPLAPPPLNADRMRRFGLSSFLLSSSGYLRETMMDNLIIAHYLNIVQVGLYGFAASFLSLVTSFNPGSVMKNVFSTLLVRKYTETGDKSYLVYGNSLIIKLSSFVLIPIFIIAAVLLRPIIQFVYDPNYLSVVPVVYLFLAFFSVNIFTYGLGHIYFVLEKVHLRLYTFAFSIYNLIMDIILIPRWGIKGAAVATGSTAILTYLYYVLSIRYLMKVEIQFPWMGVTKITLNAILAGAAAYFLLPMVQGVLSLVAVLSASGLVYLGASYLNKSFDDKDRSYLIMAFGRKIWFL